MGCSSLLLFVPVLLSSSVVIAMLWPLIVFIRLAPLAFRHVGCHLIIIEMADVFPNNILTGQLFSKTELQTKGGHVLYTW
jgi:hypothetical protein